MTAVNSARISDDMVSAYWRGRAAGLPKGESDWQCTVRGLQQVAPLIAAQALREVAGDIHQGLAGICHPECPGCRVELRADEMERGDDRG